MNWREWRNKFILIIGGLLLGLIIAEIILRLLDQPKFYQKHTVPLQFTFYTAPGQEISYTNKPSSRIRFIYDGNPRGYFGNQNEVDHFTNAAGFRGPEFSLEKPTSTLRLAFLGDSFTFGEGVWFKDTYPEITARLLNQKYQSLAINFESYNFGVGGYNISQTLTLLKKFGLQTKPDLVVLGFTFNDAESPLFTVKPLTNELSRRPREQEVPEGISSQRPPANLIFKLKTAQLVWQVFYNQAQTAKVVNYYQSLYTEDNQSWQENKAALQELIQVCQKNQLPIYVIIFPVLYQLDDSYPFQEIHQQVGALAQAAGATVIDLLPALKGRRAEKLWVHPTDQHPNEIVHKIAAEQLTAALTTNPDFEQKIRQANDGNPGK